jgi:CheY-like chemotaxis protein
MKTGKSQIVQKNALIVDDDQVILEIVSSWMKSSDWNVTTASDGAEAFELITEKQNFNLVLTDYNMPQMDGLTLAEKIKNMDPLIRIVLLTGTCRDIINQEINIIYVDDILYKPFSLDELDGVIEECNARNSVVPMHTLEKEQPYENSNYKSI